MKLPFSSQCYTVGNTQTATHVLIAMRTVFGVYPSLLPQRAATGTERAIVKDSQFTKYCSMQVGMKLFNRSFEWRNLCHDLDVIAFL